MPTWLTDQILAFGRQLELKALALDDRGMAALRFENGATLRLEYRESVLWVQMLMPVPRDGESLVRLLSESSPRRGATGFGTVRSAYLDRTGEALLAIALPRDRIEATAIDGAFRELFERAVRLGRMS